MLQNTILINEIIFKKIPMMLLAFGVFFIALNISVYTQEVPCVSARSEKLEFVKKGDRNLNKHCSHLREKNLKQRLGFGEITISGHITHQNGVRLSGVTMTLTDLGSNTSINVVSDEMGNYFFGSLVFGSRYQLIPSKEGYEFFPPGITWEGIVESEIQDFIAVGPPPVEPPDPPGTPTLAWTSYYGDSSNSNDFNGMLGRDANGNIYLGGTSYVADDGNTNIVVSKIDVNGNLVWARSFEGTANYKDGIADMKVAPNGDIYITGYSYSLPTNSGQLRSYDFITLKYDTNGELIWSKDYGAFDGFDDSPDSLKIDVNGNIVISGYSWGNGTFANYATLKYDSNGNLLWANRYVGGNGELPAEVETDAQGNVYITGYSNNSAAGSSEDIVTIKYSPSGEQLWLNRYDSPAQDTDEGFEIEIDSNGDVFVLGRSYVDFSDADMIVQKINGTDGTNVWVRTYTVMDSFEGFTYPTAFDFDSNGNIVIAGMTNLSGGFYEVDAFVAKFDNELNLQWERTYDGPSNEDYDGDTKMVLDNDGNIIIGASSEGFANVDIQLIKYSPKGDELWRYRFGNPFFGFDALMDYSGDVAQSTMLLDEEGNVYIAGETAIPGQSLNLIAFKLEPIAQNRAVPFDFDGDKKADLAVYRPSNGVWFVRNSRDGSISTYQWGLANDKLVPADYDGDGKYDLAVFRDGIWYIVNSSDGTFRFDQFGITSDKPIPSDFDNDGKSDLGVFREGIWHQLNSADNSYKAFQFGLSSDKPIPSDFDKNRRSDVAVYRNGVWYVSYQANLTLSIFQFGINTDIPVPADYDGDKQTDHAVFRNGVWYVWQSRYNFYKTFQWGISTDIPVPADYDGDEKTDFAVYRNGVWYIWQSSDDTYQVIQFGLETDKPIPAAYR